MRKKFKDTKVEMRSRNEGEAIQWPNKGSHDEGQTIQWPQTRTKNDLQNITQNTK
jgi:hypothetical protein